MMSILIEWEGHSVRLPITRTIRSRIAALAKEKALPESAVAEVVYGRMLSAADKFLKSQGA